MSPKNDTLNSILSTEDQVLTPKVQTRQKETLRTNQLSNEKNENDSVNSPTTAYTNLS